MAGRARGNLRDLWEHERWLSLLLGVLVLILFVLPLFRAAPPLRRLIFDFALSALLLAGITATSRRRHLRAVLTTVVLAALALRWLEWLAPSAALDFAAGAASLVSTTILAAIVLARVFLGGRVTHDRILGAVAVYLLLGLVWAQAYGLVARFDPEAFRGVADADSPYAFFYYSVVTLTSVGYGDVTPVHPVARSLAMLEALTGQLYPAILLARLVSLEIAGRATR